MNQEKRRKRAREKKKAHNKAVYHNKIKEFDELKKKAYKGLEEIDGELNSLLDGKTIEEINEERAALEKETDKEEEKKNLNERVGRINGLIYTKKVFSDIIEQADNQIGNYKENIGGKK